MQFHCIQRVTEKKCIWRCVLLIAAFTMTTGDSHIVRAEESLSASAAEYERLCRPTLGHINLPDTPAPPFAESTTPLDLRFVTAGVLVLVDAGQADLQVQLWKRVEQAAIRGEGTAHWEVDAPDFMGDGRAVYTGMLHGASGIGLAILNMHARLSGRVAYISMPDSPSVID